MSAATRLADQVDVPISIPSSSDAVATTARSSLFEPLLGSAAACAKGCRDAAAPGLAQPLGQLVGDPSDSRRC